ncbi:MAG: hypothetical protein ACPGQD_03710 [Planctomycetota bacterium]
MTEDTCLACKGFGCNFCRVETPADVAAAKAEENRRQAAEDWMHEHPEALEVLEELALRRAQKRAPFGIKMLFEVARWEFVDRWGRDARGYKLNNNHAPYVARALIAKHPVLEDLIRVRRTRW